MVYISLHWSTLSSVRTWIAQLNINKLGEKISFKRLRNSYLHIVRFIHLCIFSLDHQTKACQGKTCTHHSSHVSRTLFLSQCCDFLPLLPVGSSKEQEAAVSIKCLYFGFIFRAVFRSEACRSSKPSAWGRELPMSVCNFFNFPKKVSS